MNTKESAVARIKMVLAHKKAYSVVWNTLKKNNGDRGYLYTNDPYQSLRSNSFLYLLTGYSSSEIVNKEYTLGYEDEAREYLAKFEETVKVMQEFFTSEAPKGIWTDNKSQKELVDQLGTWIGKYSVVVDSSSSWRQVSLQQTSPIRLSSKQYEYSDLVAEDNLVYDKWVTGFLNTVPNVRAVTSFPKKHRIYKRETDPSTVSVSDLSRGDLAPTVYIWIARQILSGESSAIEFVEGGAQLKSLSLHADTKDKAKRFAEQLQAICTRYTKEFQYLLMDFETVLEHGCTPYAEGESQFAGNPLQQIPNILSSHKGIPWEVASALEYAWKVYQQTDGRRESYGWSFDDRSLGLEDLTVQVLQTAIDKVRAAHKEIQDSVDHMVNTHQDVQKAVNLPSPFNLTQCVLNWILCDEGRCSTLSMFASAETARLDLIPVLGKLCGTWLSYQGSYPGIKEEVLKLLKRL